MRFQEFRFDCKMEYTKKEKKFIRKFFEKQQQDQLLFYKTQEDSLKVLKQAPDFHGGRVRLLQAEENQNHREAQYAAADVMIAALNLKRSEERKRAKLAREANRMRQLAVALEIEKALEQGRLHALAKEEAAKRCTCSRWEGDEEGFDFNCPIDG